jgi:hypothetical protein
MFCEFLEQIDCRAIHLKRIARVDFFSKAFMFVAALSRMVVAFQCEFGGRGQSSFRSKLPFQTAPKATAPTIYQVDSETRLYSAWSLPSFFALYISASAALTISSRLLGGDTYVTTPALSVTFHFVEMLW